MTRVCTSGQTARRVHEKKMVKVGLFDYAAQKNKHKTSFIVKHCSGDVVI